jgi:type IV secretion system protein VirB8
MAKSKEEKQAEDQYLAEANYWSKDKVKSLNRSNKVAWGLAVFGLGLATVATWSVGQLVPLKTVEPYVIRVSETSGSVDIVTGLKNGKQTYEEALNKYFLIKYVRYREAYSRTLAEEHYYSTGLMSGKAEKKRYFTWFSPKNPQSPLNIYGENEKVYIDVQSVSFLGDNRDIALIRYIKKVETSAGQKPIVTHWAATAKFQYSSAPTKERDREITPLGFQVVEYRNDPDTVGDIQKPTITYKEAKKIKPTVKAGIFPQARTTTDE